MLKLSPNLPLILVFMLALFVPAFKATGKEGPLAGNRLADMASPYLRQHADNPVDWYPWGEEAFARARKENKPIFLSVGYSTCYWCHVMKRESFENEDIARILNKYFIAIKVDRERRPDIDETYMIATQIITGGGGWPNSVFLTPDLKPFSAGTYFPRDDFERLLKKTAVEWKENERFLRHEGERVSGIISNILNRRVAARRLTTELVRQSGSKIMRDADEFHGGFDTAPKFPNEPLLMFLLQLAAGHGDREALETVTRTLDAMLDGGIHDQVGGGFHRYAIDNVWRVPHFEKMLYNQAQMVRVLLQAYRLTGKQRYADAARRTLSYVEHYMTSNEGGFYSAWDAESEKREGAYYVWTPEQLRAALGPQEGRLAAKIFGVTPEGNFDGHTVLHFPESQKEMAARLKMSHEDFLATVARIRKKLKKARDGRVAPHLDDKILLSWNGMMVVALSNASIVLKDRRYQQQAEKALSFIESKLKQPDGSYLRSYYKGRADLVAQQEDYVWLALANLMTYDATRKIKYLKKAQKLTAAMIKKFLDPGAGDFFTVATSDSFVRGKDRADGAMPSGNSAALELLAMLTRRSQNPEYRNRADALLAALSGLAAESPRSGANVLRAADMMRHGETGIVQYFAGGVVRAEARIERKSARVVVALSIAPGWHINARKPLNEDFIPTRLQLSGTAKHAGKVIYPPAVQRKLEFNNDLMALYEGDVRFFVPLARPLPDSVELLLTLQACSDRICLQPVEGRLLAR